MKTLTFLTGVALGLASLNVAAATVDGVISGSEYASNTRGVEGAQHWNTFGRDRTPDEYGDASGGSTWDIRYMGTEVANGQFSFGINGGRVLSGNRTGSFRGRDIYLGDIAIGINPTNNPTYDSTGFDYAVRLLSTNSRTGKSQFALLTGGDWESISYAGYPNSHKTDTYRMRDAQILTTFEGAWGERTYRTRRGGTFKRYTLEGAFDMSFLSAFDASLGGEIGTYLAMSCVNDEASVYTYVDPVSQVPVPSALWLFSPALVGFMALRRNRRKQA